MSKGFRVYGKTLKQIRARANKLRGKGNYKLGVVHKHTKVDGTKTKYALITKKAKSKKRYGYRTTGTGKRRYGPYR